MRPKAGPLRGGRSSKVNFERRTKIKEKEVFYRTARNWMKPSISLLLPGIASSLRGGVAAGAAPLLVDVEGAPAAPSAAHHVALA